MGDLAPGHQLPTELKRLIDKTPWSLQTSFFRMEFVASGMAPRLVTVRYVYPADQIQLIVNVGHPPDPQRENDDETSAAKASRTETG